MVWVLGIPIFESGEEEGEHISKEKHHLEASSLEEDDSSTMMPPNVEALASSSFSPTSSSDGSNQDFCANESVPPPAEELMNVDSSESTDNASEELKHSKGGMKHPKLVLSTNKDDEWIPLDNPYMSKHELEVLLTPRCMDDYETMAYEEETNIEKERAFRRELIQEELEYLIQATSNKKTEKDQFDDDKDDDDESIEPEAVEALGIAANQVAYLKKFYDVVSCQYIYVPSVAYTILDGRLLEEASKHYFGKAPDFLPAYAEKLRSTIRKQQKLGRIMVEEDQPPSDLTEDLDLGDDTNIEYTDARIANLVWAVTSPKNADDIVASPMSSSVSTASLPRSFAWDEEQEDEHTGSKANKVEPIKIQVDKYSSSTTMIKRSLIVAFLSVLVIAIARFGFFDGFHDEMATNVVADVSSSLRHFVTKQEPTKGNAVGQSAKTARRMAASKKKVTVTKKFKQNDTSKKAVTTKPEPTSASSSPSEETPLPPVGESNSLSIFSSSPLVVVRGKLGYELHDESQPPKEKEAKNWFLPNDPVVPESATTASKTPQVPQLSNNKPSSIRRPIVPNLLY